MGKVTIIFVRGSETNLVDKIIADVSNGPFTHVAIKVPGVGLIESRGDFGPGVIPPCVRVSSWRKYDNADTEAIDLELPDLEAARAEAEKLVGSLYGYVDCAGGAVHDLMDIDLKGNGLVSANCSETVARVLRSGGLSILPGVEADNITPMDLKRAIDEGKYTC